MTLNHLQKEFDKMMNRDYFSDTVHPMRKEAFAQFLDLGFPTKKWEDWRFTNLSPITKQDFSLSEIQDAPQDDLDISAYEIEDTHTIVIFNGHLQNSISSLENGVSLMSGLEYLTHKNDGFTQAKNTPFDLLNTAFMDSGIALVIEKNMAIKKALRILFITSSTKNLMISPRVHIDLGNASSLSIIEHHVGDSESAFQNESVFVSIGENAKLDHVRIQSNANTVSNMANIHVQQEDDSHYSFFQFANGSQLGRLNLRAKLKGEGAYCRLDGLALSTNNQHLDHHIIIDHQVANCISHQNFRSVLQDKSSGVFSGRTIVRKNAQQTDSHQSNKNLLLSKNAFVHSIPQLEIDADDVKCAHSSTTGALDEESLFYLRSRGLDILSAKNLLVQGFVSEMIESVKHEATQKMIQSHLQNWLNSNA